MTTPESDLQAIIEKAYEDERSIDVRRRFRLVLTTGESIRFYLGRSTGTAPIFLTVHNARSLGGSAFPALSLCSALYVTGVRIGGRLKSYKDESLLWLAPVKKLSVQEVFDISATHLLRQGRKSLAPGSKTSCLYRSPDGCKCAVGPLILDPVFEKFQAGRPLAPGLGANFNSLAVYQAEVQAALRESGVNAGDRAIGHLLSELQKIHDHNPPEKWRFLLQGLAVRSGLNLDALPPA